MSNRYRPPQRLNFDAKLIWIFGHHIPSFIIWIAGFLILFFLFKILLLPCFDIIKSKASLVWVWVTGAVGIIFVTLLLRILHLLDLLKHRSSFRRLIAPFLAIGLYFLEYSLFFVHISLLHHGICNLFPIFTLNFPFNSLSADILHKFLNRELHLRLLQYCCIFCVALDLIPTKHVHVS